jgi:uncharacterized membrane protein YeaQ/YmgE (transglycosylase-associated protein family)
MKERRHGFLLRPDSCGRGESDHASQEKDKIMTVATLVLGAMLDPGGLVAWLIVGLVAGFFAGRVMRGGGFGVLGDIVVGIIGAFIGGWVSGLLGIGGSYGLIGSIVIAFMGACLLLALFRLIVDRRPA